MLALLAPSDPLNLDKRREAFEKATTMREIETAIEAYPVSNHLPSADEVEACFYGAEIYSKEKGVNTDGERDFAVVVLHDIYASGLAWGSALLRVQGEDLKDLRARYAELVKETGKSTNKTAP
jgi:hypothetical protein